MDRTRQMDRTGRADRTGQVDRTGQTDRQNRTDRTGQTNRTGQKEKTGQTKQDKLYWTDWSRQTGLDRLCWIRQREQKHKREDKKKHLPSSDLRMMKNHQHQHKGKPHTGKVSGCCNFYKRCNYMGILCIRVQRY